MQHYITIELQQFVWIHSYTLIVFPKIKDFQKVLKLVIYSTPPLETKWRNSKQWQPVIKICMNVDEKNEGRLVTVLRNFWEGYILPLHGGKEGLKR